jgi:pyruvate dehydrogenase E2 component (dihydrolipoamide acetyltransferase)
VGLVKWLSTEMEGPSVFSTPVVLIAFNRPELARRTLAAIREAAPERLFLIADGPRADRDDDAALCAETRAALDEIDWPCQVERKFPEVNSSWADGKFQRKRSINIGLAVAPSQGMGLLVPVVHDADLKDLIQISIESRQVIERARSGRPAEGDLSGATFSISNLGMLGVDEFTAIINPPEAAILAVGAIKDVPVVDDGRIVPGKVMRMTLSVDHRVFYGATAAQFMAEVTRLIENPVTLLVPQG